MQRYARLPGGGEPCGLERGKRNAQRKGKAGGPIDMFSGQVVEIVAEIMAVLAVLGGFIAWLLKVIKDGDDDMRTEAKRDLDEHRATHRAFAEKIETEVDSVRASCATREDIGRLFDAVSDVRQDVRQLVDHALGGASHGARNRRRDDTRA